MNAREEQNIKMNRFLRCYGDQRIPCIDLWQSAQSVIRFCSLSLPN